MIDSIPNRSFKAKFYEWGSKPYWCRSYLDVKNIEAPSAKSHPDLTIIMLNPGSAGNEVELKAQKDRHELDKEICVGADRTLKRITLLMDNPEIKWIRVLNLSDLKCPQSSLFFEFVAPFKEVEPHHSIFHDSRSQDLLKLILPGSYVYLAWGVNPRADCLREMAFEKLRKLKARKLNIFPPYYHPLVRHSSWSDQASRELGEWFGDRSPKRPPLFECT